MTLFHLIRRLFRRTQLPITPGTPERVFTPTRSVTLDGERFRADPAYRLQQGRALLKPLSK